MAKRLAENWTARKDIAASDADETNSVSSWTTNSSIRLASGDKAGATLLSKLSPPLSLFVRQAGGDENGGASRYSKWKNQMKWTLAHWWQEAHMESLTFAH